MLKGLLTRLEDHDETIEWFTRTSTVERSVQHLVSNSCKVASNNNNNHNEDGDRAQTNHLLAVFPMGWKLRLETPCCFLSPPRTQQISTNQQVPVLQLAVVALAATV